MRMDFRYQVDYPLIARRIKEARKFAGLTQEQLAERIDISTNAVAKLENNLMTASLQTLVSIANVLQLDINDLLCEELAHSGKSSQDLQLDSLLQNLSPREKEFVIHVIRGLMRYRQAEP